MDAMNFKSVFFVVYLHSTKLKSFNATKYFTTSMQAISPLIWKFQYSEYKHQCVQGILYFESESILVGRSACKAQQELWIALDLRSSSTSNHFEYLLPQPKQTFKFGIPYFKVFLTICPDQLMNSSFSSIFVFFPRFCFANIFIAMRSVQRLDSNSALNFMAVCSSATSKS